MPDETLEGQLERLKAAAERHQRAVVQAEVEEARLEEEQTALWDELKNDYDISDRPALDAALDRLDRELDALREDAGEALSQLEAVLGG